MSVLVGVCGGSASGKTTLSRAIQTRMGHALCDIIYQDSYYFDQSRSAKEEISAVNFDHPSAIDFELLGEHLKRLKNNQDVNLPTYCFKTHSRQKQIEHIEPKVMTIVDGILIFSQPEVRQYFDLMVFISASEEVRFKRRLARDVRERGRTPEGVKSQFYGQVVPMHEKFVEPSKKFAQLVFSGEQDVCDYVGDVVSALSERLPIQKRARSLFRV